MLAGARTAGGWAASTGWCLGSKQFGEDPAEAGYSLPRGQQVRKSLMFSYNYDLYMIYIWSIYDMYIYIWYAIYIYIWHIYIYIWHYIYVCVIYIYIYDIWSIYDLYMRCRVCSNFSSRMAMMAMMATLDCHQEQLIAPDTSQGWKAWKALHKLWLHSNKAHWKTFTVWFLWILEY